jgi:carbamoylphosphate synthase large subunit
VRDVEKSRSRPLKWSPRHLTHVRPESTTVLVTGAETPAGLAVLDQLHDLNCVSVAVRHSQHPGSPTELGAPVQPHEPGWFPYIQRVISDHRVGLVIPTSSDELLTLAAARSALGPDVEVVLADHDSLAITHDHLFSCWHLYRHGVAVPRFAVPSTLSTIAADVRALGLPVVLKRRVPGSGYEMRLMPADELTAWSRADDSWLVQEYIPGDEFTVVVWQPASEWFHEPLTVALRHRRDSAPRRTGAGDADVTALAHRAVRVLQLNGPVSVHVRRRTDGTPVVISVTPRVTADVRYVPEILHRLVSDHRRTLVS